MKLSSEQVQAALIAAIVTGIFSLITAVITAKITSKPTNDPTPTPSPTFTPTPSPTFTTIPSPTFTPTPSPTFTPTPSPTPTTTPGNPLKSHVKWDYSIFNSGDGSVEYTLKREPIYEPLRKRIDWIVDSKCVGNQFCFRNWVAFQAIFKDNDGITLEKVNLTKTGDSFPRRIVLFIPNNLWSKWSQVATVEIEKCPASPCI